MYRSYSDRADREQIRQEIEDNIETANTLLQSTELNTLEHTLTLGLLCHTYKALGMYDWNYSQQTDLPALRQSIECFTLLGFHPRLSDKCLGMIAEQRLWLCNRYKRILLKRQPSQHSNQAFTIKELDEIIDRDFAVVVAAKSNLTTSIAVEDVLYFALFEKRIGSKTKTDDAPLLDWWQDDVSDRAIMLLRAIRLGTDIYSVNIWQWQGEQLLKSISSSYGDDKYQTVLDRIVRRQNKLSEHAGRKFERPDMDEKVFWLRSWQTQYYKGYRVYSAALAQKRSVIEVIIDAPTSKQNKQSALMKLRPLVLGAKSSRQTYIEELTGFNSDCRKKISIEIEK